MGAAFNPRAVRREQVLRLAGISSMSEQKWMSRGYFTQLPSGKLT